MSEREREIRALEAIIVSQLLRERDPMNLDDLPELTDSQRAAMNALPTNLVENLWDEIDAESDEECPSDSTSTIDEVEFAGMNRAEEMTDETRKALDEARKEVIESMKKRKDQDSANS
jgi:hypothetical protein